MWLKSPLITSTHGFSTRHGGISQGSLFSLNLGGSNDSEENIETNRKTALTALGLKKDQLCLLHQIHGNDVMDAQPGVQEGDALVTNKTRLALAVGVADCYPILLEDRKNMVVAAVHAGWRGTASGIIQNTLERMTELGAEIQKISAAIGQGICYEHFNVGEEVTAQFRQLGIPDSYLQNGKIDLLNCNRFILEKAGVLPEKIWSMNRCTFEEEFFSYRRDKGITGRMWATICLQ